MKVDPGLDGHALNRAIPELVVFATYSVHSPQPRIGDWFDRCRWACRKPSSTWHASSSLVMMGGKARHASGQIGVDEGLTLDTSSYYLSRAVVVESWTCIELLAGEPNP